jgi:hypothetical protein
MRRPITSISQPSAFDGRRSARIKPTSGNSANAKANARSPARLLL